ncbi:MAG TPA: Uma2 family endonuclease [Rhodocyclaceae bacterium]|nr:Uma2 family endonuclease [Rhodocyclaceae bacterium]
MGFALRKNEFASTDDFLAWEETQTEKYEYVGGEIYAMVGARLAHAEIALNVAAALKSALRGTPCRAFISDVKLQVDVDTFYPDVLVTCDAADLNAESVVKSPKVIIEVLSPSTAAYDRGRKFQAYRGVASLQEYVLIDPDLRTIDIFRRTVEDNWLLVASEAARGLVLTSLDFVAAPETVFENV